MNVILLTAYPAVHFSPGFLCMDTPLPTEQPGIDRMYRHSVFVCNLGLVPYEPAWRLQQKLQRELLEGSGQETLLLCEHKPVITLGAGASEMNLLVDRAELQRLGIEVFKVERGGDITWHGPGQLVAYPILNLAKRRKDVGWYMRSLEEAVIRTLWDFGLQGRRVSGRTGVWIDDRHKIASLGVRISRWCTMHGLALNVCCGREGFSLINPCGLRDVQTVAMKDYGCAANVKTVSAVFQKAFEEIFV